METFYLLCDKLVYTVRYTCTVRLRFQTKMILFLTLLSVIWIETTAGRIVRGPPGEIEQIIEPLPENVAPMGSKEMEEYINSVNTMILRLVYMLLDFTTLLLYNRNILKLKNQN